MILHKTEPVAVLIAGPMRAGKSTAASVLMDKYGIPKVSLADKLKELHSTVTGSLEKDREWLQVNGQAHRAVFGGDFWVKALTDSIRKSGYESWCVDDVRYPNEMYGLYEFAKSMGMKVVMVYVKASMDTQIERGAEINLLGHESEDMSRLIGNSVRLVGCREVANLDQLPLLVLDGNLNLRDFAVQAVESIPVRVKEMYTLDDIQCIAEQVSADG